MIPFDIEAIPGLIRSQIPTGDGPIQYAEYGAGSAVLALHGAMGGYDQGLILGHAVAPEGYRVVAPSRPGYLGTPLAVGSSPEQQADACADLLDHLRIDKVTVVAVSGGGPAALRFALRHADRCGGLVMISSCAGRITARLPVMFHIIRLAATSSLLSAMLSRAAQKRLDRAAQRSIPDPQMRTRTLNDPVAGPLFAALLASTGDRLRERMPGTVNDVRITRSTEYPLEEIRVPTFIVHGTADRIVPYREHAQVLAARIPRAELLTIEGGEHVALFTHLGLIQARVRDFLRIPTS